MGRERPFPDEPRDTARGFKMTILKIIYEDRSADYRFGCDGPLGDTSLRQFAIELVRSGRMRGLVSPLPSTLVGDDAFDGHIVERARTTGEEEIVLRPA